MLGLAYRDELRKSAELLPEVKNAFEINDINSAYMLEISLPIIKVQLYAISHEVWYIKGCMEELDNNLDKADSFSYYTERLGFNNLFKCLRLLTPDCLWFVLEKIKSHHTGAIEELKNAVLSDDFNGVVSVLKKNEIDTEPITPISNVLFFQIRYDELKREFLELYKEVEASEEEHCPPEIKDKMLKLGSDFIGFLQDWNSSQHLDKIGTAFYESCERVLLSDDFEQRMNNDSPEKIELEFIKSIKRVCPNFVEDGFNHEEFMRNRYKELLSGYCQESLKLSTYAKIEIERLLKSKYFESIWSRFDEFDKNTAKVLEKEIDEYYKKHGILVDGADETEEGGMQPTPRFEESSTQKESFKDAEPKEKAKVLCTIIQELLETNKGRVEEFLGGYELCEVEGMIEAILTADAKEYTNIQREIIDDLSGTDHKNSSRYYYKDRLWLLPFFQIIGRLFKWEVLVGKRKQKAFVKALFPEMRCDKDPEFDVVYKEEFDFIETCRNRISKGNTGQPKEWKEKYEWIDKCCK